MSSMETDGSANKRKAGTAAPEHDGLEDADGGETVTRNILEEMLATFRTEIQQHTREILDTMENNLAASTSLLVVQYDRFTSSRFE